jgi:hypothetical protein
LKVLTAFKGSYFTFYVHCHWERLSNVSQTQVVRRIESKALGEAFVGDGSASQLAKASTT